MKSIIGVSGDGRSRLALLGTVKDGMGEVQTSSRAGRNQIRGISAQPSPHKTHRIDTFPSISFFAATMPHIVSAVSSSQLVMLPSFIQVAYLQESYRRLLSR
jgi:hypothetical protein